MVIKKNLTCCAVVALFMLGSSGFVVSLMLFGTWWYAAKMAHNIHTGIKSRLIIQHVLGYNSLTDLLCRIPTAELWLKATRVERAHCEKRSRVQGRRRKPVFWFWNQALLFFKRVPRSNSRSDSYVRTRRMMSRCARRAACKASLMGGGMLFSVETGGGFSGREWDGFCVSRCFMVLKQETQLEAGKKMTWLRKMWINKMVSRLMWLQSFVGCLCPFLCGGSINQSTHPNDMQWLYLYYYTKSVQHKKVVLTWVTKLCLTGALHALHLLKYIIRLFCTDWMQKSKVCVMNYKRGVDAKHWSALKKHSHTRTHTTNQYANTAP